VVQHQHQSEATVAAIKAAPPITVTGLHFFGYPIQDWVALATLVYVLLQIALLLYKVYKDNK
jgi:hypothetical protein